MPISLNEQAAANRALVIADGRGSTTRVPDAERACLLIGELLAGPGVLEIPAPLSPSSICLHALQGDPERVLVGLRLPDQPHLTLSGPPLRADLLLGDESADGLLLAARSVAEELRQLAGRIAEGLSPRS